MLARGAREKGLTLLPKGYEVVKSYAALRGVRDGSGDYIIVPETIESG